MGVWNKVI